MASYITLGDLRDAAKDRADMQNSNFITTAEWNRYINSAAKELYDILISKGAEYTTVLTQLTTDGTNNVFDLPCDFYKLVGVDYVIGDIKQPMLKFQFLDRNKYQNYESVVTYRLVGPDKIMFSPKPPVQTYDIWYNPVLYTMSNDLDAVNGVHGWEEYIIVRAAIWAMQKEESNTSDLKSDLAFLKDRIETMSENRDQGLPDRVSDANAAQYYRGPLTGWGTY